MATKTSTSQPPAAHKTPASSVKGDTPAQSSATPKQAQKESSNPPPQKAPPNQAPPKSEAKTPRGNESQTPRKAAPRKKSRDDSQRRSVAETPRPEGGVCLDENDGTASLILNVEGRQLYCHKDFLCIWSPVIKDLCHEKDGDKPTDYENLLELDLEGKEYEEVKEFLLCLYPPAEEVTDDNVVSVVSLASEYKTEKLKAQCEEVLKKRRPTVELMLIAELYELESLREQTARGLADRQLYDVENDERFDDLNDESRMMIWRERALHLEDQVEEVEEDCSVIYKMTKWVIKHHGFCKDESRYGHVSVTVRDPKTGKKRKEVLEDAAYFTLEELNVDCKDCLKQFAANCMEQVAELDRKGFFDKQREKQRKRKDEVQIR